MSSFICDSCGMTNIDCGRGGYKTAYEIELEEVVRKLKGEIKMLRGTHPEALDIRIVCPNKKYLPEYANATDACLDIKVKVAEEKILVTKNTQTEETTYEKILDNKWELAPGETHVFDAGFKIAVPVDYAMLIYPRSSTGIKLHCALANTVGVVDAGYRDEVKIALTNFGDSKVTIKDGQRVAQFVIMPRPALSLVRVEDDEDFRQGDRGGGIGSTGK